MDGRKRLSLKKKQGNDWLDEVAGPSNRKDNDIMIIDPLDKHFQPKQSKTKNNLHPQEGNSNSSHSTQSMESPACKPDKNERHQNYARLMQAMLSESLSKTGGYKSLPSSKQKVPESMTGYKSLPSSCLKCTLIRAQPLITYDSANALFRNQRETANDDPHSYTRHSDLQIDHFPSDKEQELNMSKFHALPLETTKDFSKLEEEIKFVSTDNASCKSKVASFENGMKHITKENEKSRNNFSSNQGRGDSFVGKSWGRASAPESANVNSGLLHDKSKLGSGNQSFKVDNGHSSSRQSENEINEINDLEEEFDFDLGLDDLLLDLPEANFLKTSSSASKPTRTSEKVEKGDQSSSLKRNDTNNDNEMSNNLQAEKGKGDNHFNQEFVSRKRPQQFDNERTKDKFHRNNQESFTIDGGHEKRNSSYSGLIDHERSRYTPVDTSMPKEPAGSAMPGPQSPSIHRDKITEKRRENVTVNRIHLGHTNSASSKSKDGHMSQQNRKNVSNETSRIKSSPKKERKLKKSKPDIQSYFKGSKSATNNMKSTSTATKNPHLSTSIPDQKNLSDASCPICQMKFPRGWTEFKRNNHASRCMADEIFIDDDEDELFRQIDLT